MRLNRRGRAHGAGFTLIEVLVALATTSRDLRLRMLAQWSAENRLAAIRVAGDLPPLGKTSYDCSQADEQLTCNEEVFAMPSPLFVRIEIGVFGGPSKQRLARLVAFPSRVR